MAILYYGAWLYLRVSVDLTAEGSAATLALAPAPVRRVPRGCRRCRARVAARAAWCAARARRPDGSRPCLPRPAPVRGRVRVRDGVGVGNRVG
eukprot:scaffold80335_cov73-Phaeocystis_antarctica.AAC.2